MCSHCLHRHHTGKGRREIDSLSESSLKQLPTNFAWGKSFGWTPLRLVVGDTKMGVLLGGSKINVSYRHHAPSWRGHAPSDCRHKDTRKQSTGNATVMHLGNRGYATGWSRTPLTFRLLRAVRVQVTYWSLMCALSPLFDVVRTTTLPCYQALAQTQLAHVIYVHCCAVEAAWVFRGRCFCVATRMDLGCTAHLDAPRRL